MTYDEFFTNKFKQCAINYKDSQQDEKVFKTDFYNLILKKLQIYEEYKQHFSSKRELSEKDIVFLNEFFSLITGDSVTEETEYINERSIGKKQENKNGRRILKNQLNFFCEELYSIYHKFQHALENDQDISFIPNNNPIYQTVMKESFIKRLSSKINNLSEAINKLPDCQFNYIFSKLMPNISEIFNTFTSIINEFLSYTNIKFFGVFLSEDGSITEEEQITLKNNLASDLIKREFTPHEAILYKKIKKMEKDKSSYRSTQRELQKMKDEFNKELFNNHQAKIEAIGLTKDTFDFSDEDDIRTLTAMAKIYYRNATENLPGLNIKF